MVIVKEEFYKEHQPLMEEFGYKILNIIDVIIYGINDLT
jgi:hypothetical protein